MTIETAQGLAPTLFAALQEQIFVCRELVAIDENYQEEESEEVAEFDPEAYNYMIYIAEPTQKVLGQDGMQQLIKKLEQYEAFADFLVSEEDLYGVQSDRDEEEISRALFVMLEEILS